MPYQPKRPICPVKTALPTSTDVGDVNVFDSWLKINSALQYMPLDRHTYSCGYGNILEYDYKTAFAENPTNPNLGQKYLAGLTHHALRALIGSLGSSLNKTAQTRQWKKSRKKLDDLMHGYTQTVKFGKNLFEAHTFAGASDSQLVAFNEEAIHEAERKCPLYHSTQSLKSRLVAKQVAVEETLLAQVDTQDNAIDSYYHKTFQILCLKEEHLYLKGSTQPFNNVIATHNDLPISGIEALTMFTLATRGILNNLKMPSNLGYIMGTHLKSAHNIYPRCLDLLSAVGLSNNPTLGKIAQRSFENFKQQTTAIFTPQQQATLRNNECTSKIVACLGI